MTDRKQRQSGIGGCGGVLLAVLLVMCRPQFVRAQVAAVADREYDCGLIEAGTVIEHEFILTNTSATSLTVVDSKVSCPACVSVRRDWSSLGAGEEGIIVVRVDTTGKRGMLRQWALLVTDNEDVPSLKCTVRGAIRSAWLYPSRIDLRHIRFGERREVSFQLRAVGMTGMRIESADSSGPSSVHMNIMAQESPDDAIGERSVPVIAKGTCEFIAPRDRVGGITETIRVRYEYDGRAYELKVRVDAYVVGHIDSRPPQIFFGKVDDETIIERSIVLQTSEDLGASLGDLRLEAEHRFIECLTEVIEQGCLAVTVRLRGSDAIGDGVIQGTIVGRCGEELICAVPYTFFRPQVKGGRGPVADR